VPNATIERFFDKHGRLPQLPVRADTQRELSEYLAGFLEVGQRYTEREVNDILMRFSDEYVALRRMLIDYRVLMRDSRGAGYWREVA
jgi:hypothetical protein